MRQNAVGTMMAVVGLGWLVAVVTFDPAPRRVPRVEVLEPSPSLEWTTDAGAVLPFVAKALPGRLPSPGPNQKRSGQCDPEAAQVEVAGGCWVETRTPPPCPQGKQWEHEGKCWLPVAKAAPVPTSGGGGVPGVAGQ